MVDDDVAGQRGAGRAWGRSTRRSGACPSCYALRQEELQRTLEVDRRLALRLELERRSAPRSRSAAGGWTCCGPTSRSSPGTGPPSRPWRALLESRQPARRAGRRADRSGHPARGARRQRAGGGPHVGLVAPRSSIRWAIAIGPSGAYERVAELEPAPEPPSRRWAASTSTRASRWRAAGWLERWPGGRRLAAHAGRPGAGRRVPAGGQADHAPWPASSGPSPTIPGADGRAPPAHRAAPGAARPGSRSCARSTTAPSTVERCRDTVLAYAREAAEVAQERLARPARGPRRARSGGGPGPRGEAPCACDSPRPCSPPGELIRRAALLEGLIQESGRRRSRERANLHHRMARVARAESKRDEALEHLEQAAEMDVDSAAVLRDAGRGGRGAGRATIGPSAATAP